MKIDEGRPTLRKVQVGLNENDHSALCRAAYLERLSLAAYVRRILCQYLEQNGHTAAAND